MGELNLIIIWENARAHEDKILENIQASFKICEVIDLEWSREKFGQNLTRFYGQNLPKGSDKELHCGNGRFLLVTFIDEMPVYELRQTSRGSESVNKNVFDKKTLYREWTGGGHKIHSTNGVHETNHDLILLLGVSVEEYYQDVFKSEISNGLSRRSLAKDLEGCDGWSSFEHLFNFINRAENYVVLRNFEELPANYLVNGHGDIDFMVGNAASFAYLIGAVSIESAFRPFAYTIVVDNEPVPIDLRQIGDGYYDKSWQSEILATAEVNSKGIMIPNESNFFPSLVYHVLLHKLKVTKDYKNTMDRMLGSRNPESFLSDFLDLHNYRLEVPKDISVYFNFKNARSLGVEVQHKYPLRSVSRAFRQWKYEFRSSIRPFLGKVRRRATVLSSYGFIKKTYENLRKQGYDNIEYYLLDAWHNDVFLLKCTKGDRTFLVKASKNARTAEREYAALKALEHTGLTPEVLTLSFIDGGQFVLIEFVEDAKPLDCTYRDREKLYTFFQNVNLALIEKNVVHRDIRPENILVDITGRLYLIDFGWSLVAGDVFDDASFPEELSRLGEAFRLSKDAWQDSASFGKVFEYVFSESRAFESSPKVKYSA